MTKNDFTRMLASIRVKKTREWKRQKFEEVCKKNKVENALDICSIYYGLSRKAIEKSVYAEVCRLAARGLSPKEIVDFLEPKKSLKV